MNPYIYLRALRHADFTVFSVVEGQKRYYDNQFQTYVAYASGQQVKRSILEEVTIVLNEVPAPITFYFEAPSLKEKEVTSPGDPSFADQLLGGWMIAQSGGGGRTIKRRSPLSISAMRPLHPLLGGVQSENISFDRSDRPDLHKVVVKDASGKVLSEEEIAQLLSGSDRSLRRKWIQDNKRTTGLFIYDVAIDLRTLFCVSLNQLEPELSQETIDQLKKDGWRESQNTFGKCLLCPEKRRKQIIPALAHALINWRILTNQSRTFSPMEVLAVAISQNANKIAQTIRAKLIEEGEKPIAKPIVDDTIENAKVYVTLSGTGYFSTNVESADALEKAEEKLIELMNAFNYENQLRKEQAQ
ncbi:MAG TPA: hypothetical protein VHD35_04460 [Chitinophagaceae bacterium]|nr:hypothetical protein [Chitinophagaceae bacterium]